MSTVTPGYIYLVHAVSSDLYKIGLTTRTPEQRLKELNGSQSPYQLELYHYIYVEDVHASEDYFHNRYNAYHHHREWFKLRDSVVDELVLDMNNYATPSVAIAENNNEITNMIAAVVGGAMGLAILVFGLAQCSQYSSPKYSECISHGGGAACERFLKINK